MHSVLNCCLWELISTTRLPSTEDQVCQRWVTGLKASSDDFWSRKETIMSFYCRTLWRSGRRLDKKKITCNIIKDDRNFASLVEKSSSGRKEPACAAELIIIATRAWELLTQKQRGRGKTKGTWLTLHVTKDKSNKSPSNQVRVQKRVNENNLTLNFIPSPGDTSESWFSTAVLSAAATSASVLATSHTPILWINLENWSYLGCTLSRFI